MRGPGGKKRITVGKKGGRREDGRSPHLLRPLLQGTARDALLVRMLRYSGSFVLRSGNAPGDPNRVVSSPAGTSRPDTFLVNLESRFAQ